MRKTLFNIYLPLLLVFASEEAMAIGLIPNKQGRCRVEIGSSGTSYALGAWDSLPDIDRRHLGSVGTSESIQFVNFRATGAQTDLRTTTDIDVEFRVYPEGSAPPSFGSFDMEPISTSGEDRTEFVGVENFVISSSLVPGEYIVDFRMRVRCSNNSISVVGGVSDGTWTATFTKQPPPRPFIEFQEVETNGEFLVIANTSDALEDLARDFTTEDPIFIKWSIRNTGEITSEGLEIISIGLNGFSVLDRLLGEIDANETVGLVDSLGTLPAGEYDFAYALTGTGVGDQVFVQERISVVEPNELDSDSDTIPDFWEEQVGLNPLLAADALLDLDGDGTPNWLEFRTGLNPSNPSSKVEVKINLSSKTLVIEPTGRGVHYEIEESVDGENWSTFGAASFLSDEIKASQSVPIPMTQDTVRLFRFVQTITGLPLE